MSYGYLTSLADWFRSAGLTCIEIPGWQVRARRGVGYVGMRPNGVMWHHTASRWTGARDAGYIATGSDVAPIANVLIDRNGTVWICAAGATNTNGVGGPLNGWSNGIVPTDTMNTNAFGMELANDGVGEPWPVAQIDAAFIVSNIVNARCGNAPSDVCTHHEWAPTRKIDPARADSVLGHWRPRSINKYGTWNNDDLRAECERRSHPTDHAIEIPTDNEDDMAYPCEGLWVYSGDPIGANYAVYSAGYKVWLPTGNSVTCKQLLLTLHGVDATIQRQPNPDMFRAFGPIMGEIPPGKDIYGL